MLLVSLGSLSGCGDSGNAPLAGSGGNTGQFRERVDEYYHGVLAAPPANGPAPAPGKSVWIISCGQAVTSCALPSESMEQAAHQLGWRVTIFDGKLDPSQFTAGMRQAIAADADGIIPVGIDCPLIKAPVEEARRAGIAVVPQVGMDCNDPALKAGPSLFSADPLFYRGYQPLSKFLRAWGAARADWVVAKTNGEAKVIDLALKEIPQAEQIHLGFEKELGRCDSCGVVATVSATPADYGTTLQQKMEQALLAHPDANAVIVNYNADLEGGVAAAIRSSGRSNDLLVGGGEGMPSDFQYFNEGLEDMIAYWNQDWASWATIDALNRVFADAPQVPEGVGWILVDRGHNASSQTADLGLPAMPIDFRAAYRKAWGL